LVLLLVLLLLLARDVFDTSPNMRCARSTANPVHEEV
jgi:hypothetical protein